MFGRQDVADRDTRMGERHMATTTIKAADGGSVSAYVAMHKVGKGPGVLCIQEIFGIKKQMRDIADMWAAEGYVEVAPDLFWRQEPGVDISDKTEAATGRAACRERGGKEVEIAV